MYNRHMKHTNTKNNRRLRLNKVNRTREVQRWLYDIFVIETVHLEGQREYAEAHMKELSEIFGPAWHFVKTGRLEE